MSDTTARPRPGEEIDAARLSAWLKTALPGAGGVEIEQFPSGHSNLTYLVRTTLGEMVLRRPPFGNRVQTAHDMGREYRVLSALHKVYDPAPRPFAYCEDPAVLGAPFYLMERRTGLVIRKQFPAWLADDAGTVRSLAVAVVDNLARLHAINPEEAGLSELGRPQGYVRRQVDGWSRRWRDAQTSELAEMKALDVWLSEQMQTESGASIIHNDYKLDNVMLDPADPTRVAAVLDWEMATLGDPLMDLGTTLAYWTESTDSPEFAKSWYAPASVAGMLTRREVVDRYAERSGRDLGGVLYYYVFGLFKVAAVLQQIYYRYAQGVTHDERFAGLPEVVALLARQGADAAGSGRFSGTRPTRRSTSSSSPDDPPPATPAPEL